MPHHPRLARAAVALSTLLPAATAPAAAAPDDPPITIRRASGPIVVDGDLADAAWQDAARLDTWYETNPGDNTPPPVENLGWIAYDDQFLYAAFAFGDEDPARLRAPFVDRDTVESSTDYAGLIIDTRNDRRTAMMFLANPRGIQYDAISDDASGEDSSPDFFWDSAARRTPTGWALEIRIPFSTLRYDPKAARQVWGLMAYRNHPRAYRNQYFTARIPRGASCFVCNAARLEGLEGLPTGGHWTAAPYLAASQSETPRAGLGSPLESDDPELEVGLDGKWVPSPDHVFDATVNPDFSQIESDTAQIGANERFALFFAEKRPFFLESVDLFATPIQAVYTRTITHPDWGVRGTGRFGRTSYTALLTRDDGGGSLILPGPFGSSLANQDAPSTVAIGRLRHDLAGSSFVSLLATSRENGAGNDGSNRVVGPDFRWAIGERDTVAGQLLWSTSETPQRPDLAPEWDGRQLEDHAAALWWSHSTSTWDWYLEGRDVGDEFRADVGFVPQVGYQSGYGEIGRTFRPRGFVRRIRLYQINGYDQTRDGELAFRQTSAGFGLDARWSSFLRLRWARETYRVGDQLLGRDLAYLSFNASPGRRWAKVGLDGFFGEDVDFQNGREGRGGSLTFTSTFRPTDHLDLGITLRRRFLDVPSAGRDVRLFTARVERLKATYTFDARTFLRLVVQAVETERRVEAYNHPVRREDRGVDASLLFAYKLNWQTVLFAGVGDQRALDDDGELADAGRQLFLKLSYAFQR
jgi:hypothetical protein